MLPTIDRPIKLSDKYELTSGEVFLTGLQALVRLPIEQHQADKAAGLNTATLISGYEGSPLAGLDLELLRQKALLDENQVVFKPGVNEELAANAVQGSQLASASPSRIYDGVVGIWYGKAPGLDRATDALRHANLGGSASNGGVLALVGDDSIAKSSTVPSSSEVAIAEIGMPILSPSDPEDILRLGLHGIAMSRFCGLWVGMKLATNVVDGSSSTPMSASRTRPILPSNVIDAVPYVHEVSGNFLQPNLTKLEKSLVTDRLELARRYVVENQLNPVRGAKKATLGIVAAGITYRDTWEALKRIGLNESTLEDSGIRLLKLDVIHPLDPSAIIEFASGLDEILVVEEKKAFVELAIKDILFDQPSRPQVFGKRGPGGTALLRADSDLPPEYIASAIAPRILARAPHPIVSEFLESAKTNARRAPVLLPLLQRTPYFCSGCPHNRSTEVPEGSLVGAGIGCHAIVAFMPEERIGDVIGLSQMGGEGAPWIGMAPFVEQDHLIQNLGDGTFHHSGVLAIRASVAARSNITYKILYNDAVAMTGGQQAVGKLSVVSLVQELLAEGVVKVVITTEDLQRYRRTKLPKGVRVLDRSRLLDVQNELATIPGVTVLIHDQECATELRRKRKRKLVADPVERAFINERACEGCGDCGQKSNCMSVQPVTTAFGRKTRIDQASCNKDYSCLDGDCPSFVSVVPGKKKPKVPSKRPDASQLPDPIVKVDAADFAMRITGMGGTGVVTTSQIIATAASLAGLQVSGLDQLGLAQKGGAVVSDVKFSTLPIAGTNKVGVGECDLYLGCDMLVAADAKNLATASAEKTIAIGSTSAIPTGAMILDPRIPFPSTAEVTARIGSVTRSIDNVFADTRTISRNLFGTDQYSNIFLVGMAVQSGALPLKPAFLERAIVLNGVAVERNIDAFQAGRAFVVDPAFVVEGEAPSGRTHRKSDSQVASITARVSEEATDAVRTTVNRNVAELIAFQSVKYALSYALAVESVREQECSIFGRSGSLTEAYVDSLFKLMAYKDEYEVARLYLDEGFEQSLRSEFGEDAKFSYKLHPPILRALGMRKKITLGPWFKHVFRLLYALRVVRGTLWDPFGYAAVRRVERELARSFKEDIPTIIGSATAGNRSLVEQLVSLPDVVRGYENIKLDNVARYRVRYDELLAEIGSGSN